MSGIYVCSKIKYAPLWQGLRNTKNWPICSRWIDVQVGPDNETPEAMTDLWDEVILPDLKCADVLLVALFESEEVLKGGLVEIGIALGLGKPVVLYSPLEDSLLRKRLGTWPFHPLVRRYVGWEEASVASLGFSPKV